MGMIEWGQKSKPKKILGLPTKPKKSPGPKINPLKNPMPNFQALKISRKDYMISDMNYAVQALPRILRLF